MLSLAEGTSHHIVILNAVKDLVNNSRTVKMATPLSPISEHFDPFDRLRDQISVTVGLAHEIKNNINRGLSVVEAQ